SLPAARVAFAIRSSFAPPSRPFPPWLPGVPVSPGRRANLPARISPAQEGPALPFRKLRGQGAGGMTGGGGVRAASAARLTSRGASLRLCDAYRRDPCEPWTELLGR